MSSNSVETATDESGIGHGGIRRRRRRSGVAAICLALLAPILLDACSSGSSAGAGPAVSPVTAPAPGVDAAARALLPASIISSGVVKYASSFDYPPADLVAASGAYQGVDPDVLTAMSKVLGVKFDYTKLKGFASEVPAVTSGRVDVVGEWVDGLAGRLKQISLVKYLLLTDGLLVPKGNPHHITTGDMCGISVSNETGSEEVDLYNQVSKKCTAQGKPALKNEVYSSESEQLLAVTTGRAEAGGFAVPTGGYIAKTSGGKFEMAPGGPVEGQSLPLGFAVAKTSDATKLGQAMTAALKVLEANGTLKAIFAKWGMPASTIGVGFQTN